ncbi:MAG: hypothetical protein QGH45_05980 [Myxococcota bacterium]|nr:hypothetical protein [Myxococcota bacterium]
MSSWAALAAGCSLVCGCPVFSLDDDDSAAGDDDDSTSAAFTFLSYDFTLDVDGADAQVLLDVVPMDADRVPLCVYPIEFGASYADGPDLGGPFWSGVDEGLTLLTATDPGTTDCLEGMGKPYHDTPADLLDGWNPMGFLSCEEAAFDPSFLGDDPTGAGDGTFAGYCLVTAPAVREALPELPLGEVEAIWLGRGIEGPMDPLGSYEYLPADDGSFAWFAWGLLFAEEGATAEPCSGLCGRYRTFAFWVFVPF